MNLCTRVLVVEDEETTCKAICDAVKSNSELELVGNASNLDTALDIFGREPIDVVLLDLALGDRSGQELIEVRPTVLHNRNAKILVISVLGDERSVIAAVEAGADGYLLKEEAVGKIGESIREILSEHAPISPAAARHLLRRLRTNHEPSNLPIPCDFLLSRRELQMLEALAEGCSYKEVAENYSISYHTVADYVKSLYQKLHVGSRGEAVAKGLRNGLVRMDRNERHH